MQTCKIVLLLIGLSKPCPQSQVVENMLKISFILFLSSSNCAVHEFDKGGHRALIIVAARTRKRF